LNLDNLFNLKERISKNILKPSKLYASYFKKYIKHPESKDIRYSDLFEDFSR